MLLLVGAYGFVHEVRSPGDGRFYIIVGSLTLMGVPLALQGDKLIKKNNDTNKENMDG